MKWTKYIAMIGSGVVATSSHAVRISFTEAEGYTAGNIRDQSDWWGDNHWEVDPAGEGQVKTDTEWTSARLKGMPFVLPAGSEITFRVDFRILGSDAHPDANVQLVSFNFESATDDNHRDGVYLLLNVWAAAQSLRLKSHNYADLEPAAWISGGPVGKTLTVEYTLQLGDTAENSTISAKLINTTDGTESALGTISGINAEVFSAATNQGVNLRFEARDFKANNSMLTGVVVDEVSIRQPEAPRDGG